MESFINNSRRDATELIQAYSNNPRLVSYANQWRDHLSFLTSTTTTSSNNPHFETVCASTTVFGLDFVDQSKFLAACTSHGEVCIWILPEPPSTLLLSADDLDEDEEFSSSNKRRKRTTAPTIIGTKSPVLRLKLSDGALYACKWVDRSRQRQRQQSTAVIGSRWLVVSGDDGVIILDWDAQILPLIEQRQEGEAYTADKNASQQIRYSCKPKAHLKAFPSAFENCIEVNDFVICDSHLFGAAGDAFGCYKFDIETEKVVTNYREKGNTGYLHTVEMLPNTNHLLFGGEDGILSLFDTATDQPVDRFDMNTPRDGKARKNSSVTGGSWISSCRARDEHWWTVAGGNSKGRGFVATFHGPTRSVISTAVTMEAPQQLAYYSIDHSSRNNKHASGSSSKVLLSVANESYISHWNNPLSLCDEHTNQPERQRVYCSQPSAYAVSVSSGSTKRIAVGGVGSLIDIFEHKTQDGIQLSLY